MLPGGHSPASISLQLVPREYVLVATSCQFIDLCFVLTGILMMIRAGAVVAWTIGAVPHVPSGRPGARGHCPRVTKVALVRFVLG